MLRSRRSLPKIERLVRRFLRPVTPVLPAIALFALAGCKTASTIPSYVAPQDGDTAKLVFRAKASPGVGYGVYAFDDPHTCAKPLLVGKGNASKAPDTSSVRAGPLTTLRYVAVDQSKRVCMVTLSFYAAPRHTYVLFSEQGASDCRIRLADATDGENIKPAPAYPRRTQAGSLRCAPLPQVAKPEGSASSSDGGGAAPVSPTTRQLDDLKDLLPE